MKQGWSAFWQQREPRERAIIAGGAALLIIALLYAFVWEPIVQDRERLQTRVPQLIASARQIEQDASEIERLRALPRAPVSAQGLQSAIEQSAAASNLRDKITRVAADGNNRSRVQLAAVAFDQWLSWVAKLQNEQRIRVEAAQVEALAEPGMVKVNAVFVSAQPK